MRFRRSWPTVLVLGGMGCASAFAANTIQVQLPICAQPFTALSFDDGVLSFTVTTQSVTKPIDACTPNIAQAVSQGTHLATVTVTLGSPALTYKWILQDVILKSTISGGTGPGNTPTEVVNWTIGSGRAEFPVDNKPVKYSRYAANLHKGDSLINATNTGETGAQLQSGSTANITGAICLNVYAFAPDEQMVSCCSCPVTPNGLVSLSANQDLAFNTLTPAVVDALVIKLVATVPVGGSCTNSAGSVTTATLAPGLVAWGTTVHETPTAGRFAMTESAFSPESLSNADLSRLGNLCNFILANGSGYGLCRSCRVGGIGALRQRN